MDNGELEQTARKQRGIKYPVSKTVKMDFAMLEALERIADFEHEATATLARNILLEKIQVYFRNPAFKRYLKKHPLVRWEQSAEEE